MANGNSIAIKMISFCLFVVDVFFSVELLAYSIYIR